MSNTEKPPLPWWAWASAAACFAIPVVALGGAIPGALGVGGAAACVGIARNGRQSVATRLSLCAAVTLACWGAFGLLAYSVFSHEESKQAEKTSTTSGIKVTPTTSHGQPDEALDLKDEEQRREVYRFAAKYWRQIRERREERRDHVDQGKSTDFLDKSIARLKGHHEKRAEYCCERRKISRAQLDDILAEGDREGW